MVHKSDLLEHDQVIEPTALVEKLPNKPIRRTVQMKVLSKEDQKIIVNYQETKPQKEDRKMIVNYQVTKPPEEDRQIQVRAYIKKLPNKPIYIQVPVRAQNARRKKR